MRLNEELQEMTYKPFSPPNTSKSLVIKPACVKHSPGKKPYEIKFRFVFFGRYVLKKVLMKKRVVHVR